MAQAIVNEKADIRDALEMFQKLPQEERLRVEGIVIGMTLAREQGRPAAQKQNRLIGGGGEHIQTTAAQDSA